MTEPKQYTVERIRDRLALDPHLGELDVQVKVVGRDVFLRGHVLNEERRDRITTSVRELCPNHQVHNEISVGTPNESSEPEELT
jgi:osmotically-inducible protein OsmY